MASMERTGLATSGAARTVDTGDTVSMAAMGVAAVQEAAPSSGAETVAGVATPTEAHSKEIERRQPGPGMVGVQGAGYVGADRVALQPATRTSPSVTAMAWLAAVLPGRRGYGIAGGAIRGIRPWAR